MLNSRKGFTLVEMVVAMAVFIIVVMITADSFKTILTQVTKLSKSEESNIEGVLGLEMFRHDIQQAGYGLPYSFLSSIQYFEAADAPASKFNDGDGTTASAVPRAIAAGDNLAAATESDESSQSYNILAGTDYLALKGTSLGLNAASQKWTYMPYSSAVTGKLRPRIWQSGNMESGRDRVIVTRKGFSDGTYTNQLLVDSSTTAFSATYRSDGFDSNDAAFRPTLKEEVYYLYGLKSDGPVGMPFNRTDYFVASPVTSSKKPSFCADDTGILYKAVVNHKAGAGGALTYIPLLDCVADMQVVFGWDVDDGQGNEGQDGTVDTFSTPRSLSGSITVSGPSSLSSSVIETRVISALSDPEKLRNSLKLVKVYILAQIGRRDSGYQSAASIPVGDATADSISTTYALSSVMRQYHWKVYRLIVRPKNLQSNQ